MFKRIIRAWRERRIRRLLRLVHYLRILQHFNRWVFVQCEGHPQAQRRRQALIQNTQAKIQRLDHELEELNALGH